MSCTRSVFLKRPARLGRGPAILAMLVSAASMSGHAFAQENTPRVTIEINRADANADDCRITMVEKNATSADIGTLKLDLVVFDAQGIVAKRIAVDAGALKAGRTFVRTFDLKQIACTSVTRILINDVLDCDMAGLSSADCLDAIGASSRTALSFEK